MKFLFCFLFFFFIKINNNVGAFYAAHVRMLPLTCAHPLPFICSIASASSRAVGTARLSLPRFHVNSLSPLSVPFRKVNAPLDNVTVC